MLSLYLTIIRTVMKLKCLYAVIIIALAAADCGGMVENGPERDITHNQDTIAPAVVDTLLPDDPLVPDDPVIPEEPVDPVDTTDSIIVIPVLVDSVMFDRDTLTMTAGAADTLSVKVLPENATDTTTVWSTSDSVVAIVSNGIITAVGAGSAVITAVSGNASASCSVTVNRVGQHLSFEKGYMRILVGPSEKYSTGTYYPLPQVPDGAMTEVSYSSSDPSIAEISGDRIIFYDYGIVTVTATAARTACYAEDCASYNMNVVMTDSFSLENHYVSAYLDEAVRRYTDVNYNTVCLVKSYCANSSSNRKDIPAPAMIYWEKSSPNVAAEVVVYNNPRMDDEGVTSVYTAADSAAVYNLIPGEKYYYKVIEGRDTVKSGSFSTEGRCRMMKVSNTYGSGHANNCRDIGGKKTSDGHTVRYGLIYRGTNMDATTNHEKSVLIDDMGIKTDIDLRDGTPSAVHSSNPYGMGECNQPFYSVRWDVDYLYAGFSYFTDLVKPDRIRKIFEGIINSVTNGKPCYIHCAVGADRTGYVCMLLEAALGVTLKWCSIDYELTSFSCAGDRSRDGSSADFFFTEGRRYIAGYSNASFCENARKILLDAGITQAQLDALRSAMLQ